jgi:hypothetical protein
MAMTSKTWSISGASVELGVDRRTIARRIDHHGIEAAGEGPGGFPVYRMRDIFGALTGYCWECGWAERTDDSARSFFRFFETDGRAQALLDRLDAVPRDCRLRALREHFAGMLWAAIGTESGLDEPQWSELPESWMREAWMALAEGARLEDVVLIAQGEWPTYWWGPQAEALPDGENATAFDEMRRERDSRRASRAK